MAITTTKVTYSLNPQTVERVQELATAWGVPKSEVVRRVVDKAAMERLLAPRNETPLEAFRRIQKSGGLSLAAAKRFKAQLRRERKAWGRKSA